MKTYELNKTFATYEDCEKWKEENCPNRTYKGEMILTIGHQQECGNQNITLTTITTL